MNTVFDQQSQERMIGSITHRTINTEDAVAELAQSVACAQTRGLVEALVRAACRAFIQKAQGWTPGQIRGENAGVVTYNGLNTQDKTAQALLRLLLSWLPTDPKVERSHLQAWVEQQVLSTFGELQRTMTIPAQEIVANLWILEHLIAYNQVVVAKGTPTRNPYKKTFHTLQSRWNNFLYNHLIGFSAEVFLDPRDKILVQDGKHPPLPLVATETHPILDQVCLWLLSTATNTSERNRFLLIVGSYGFEQTLAYIHPLFWHMLGDAADRYSMDQQNVDDFLANPLQWTLERGVQHINARLLLCYLGVSSRMAARRGESWQDTVLRVDPTFWSTRLFPARARSRVKDIGIYRETE